MRKVNVIVLALVAIYLLAASLALGQGGNPPASTKESGATSGHGMTAVEQTGKGGANVEQQIAALSDQFYKAYATPDTGFMEKYFADDFTAIHSDGKVATKAQEIDSVKSGVLRWESTDLHERKIHAYGNTALVVTLASSKGTFRGKPYSGDYRNTLFWAKQKGNWQLVLLHITRVASPSQ